MKEKSSWKMHTFKTRIRKKATAPENPIWIMVSVMGNGKLKYFGESTHCKKIQIVMLKNFKREKVRNTFRVLYNHIEKINTKKRMAVQVTKWVM